MWDASDPNYNKVTGRVVPEVAGRLATDINLLVNRAGYSANKLTLVGFSLGAHVVGIAGQKTQKKVGRVVGKKITL